VLDFSQQTAHCELALLPAKTMDKVALLMYLAQVPDAPASEVADELAVSLPATGMGLLRLWRSGLVSRALDVTHGVYYYSITPKGRARVQYLSSRAR